jgi:hypothetical protein
MAIKKNSCDVTWVNDFELNKKPGTRPGLGLFQGLKLDQYFAAAGPPPSNLYDTPARTTSMVWRPP